MRAKAANRKILCIAALSGETLIDELGVDSRVRALVRSLGIWASEYAVLRTALMPQVNIS